MIKEIFKGESCTLMFTFPEAYDMGRIDSHKVYIGIQNYTGAVDGQSIVLKLKSSDTDKLCGVQKIVLWFDDSTLGLRKPYCGDLVITKTKAEADNESESNIYDIIIPIIISETAVTVGDILYNYVKGANGSNGRGISNLELISTEGLVKTYRITYTDSTTFEYSVSDGSNANVTASNVGTILNGLDADTVDDTSTFSFYKTALKKITWVNIKATLKTYFDGIYQVAIGFTPENTANKKTTLTDSDVDFPTTKTVNTALALKESILLAAEYTHTTNKEVVVSSVDVSTDTFTSVAHGLENNNLIFPILNINSGAILAIDKYPGGITFLNGYYVVNKTDNTFQLSLTSGGASIDLTTNANMDLTKWHFERFSGEPAITNLPASNQYKVVVRGRTLKKGGDTTIKPNNLGSSAEWTPSATAGFEYTQFNLFGDIFTSVEFTIITKDFCTIRCIGSRSYSNSSTQMLSTNVFRTHRSLSMADTLITSLVFWGWTMANGTNIKIYRL